MSVTIHCISLWSDSFTKKLDWNDVIGLNVNGAPTIDRVNIEIEASATALSSLPDAIKVKVTSRLPNKQGGASTLAAPLTWAVPRWTANPPRPGRPFAEPLAKFDKYLAPGSPPANGNHTLYRLSRPIAQAGNFLSAAAGKTLEVATIVRPNGTSDAMFRQALGWTLRGTGTLPANNPSQTTGSEALENPDALRLLWSAGVEVLEASVMPEPAWKVLRPPSASLCPPGSIARLIRSPADILYYSGHGVTRGSGGTWVHSPAGYLQTWGGNNCLAIEPVPGSFTCWAQPSDILQYWKSPMDLDVLILAGCSVLDIRTNTVNPMSTPGKPGLAWAKLLTTKGGPLIAILGYAGSAPSDKAGGDLIATEMGQRIAAGSKNWVQDWLKVNGNNRAWNAAGMDKSGFWWLSPSTTGQIARKTGLSTAPAAYTIKGPIPIP